MTTGNDGLADICAIGTINKARNAQASHWYHGVTWMKQAGGKQLWSWTIRIVRLIIMACFQRSRNRILSLLVLP